MSNWDDYTWIVVTGCLAAFFTAYGIGANDVANAFGSSVAARTLTMRQALAIATVCEFSGSVLLGGEVTRTVAGSIAKLVAFEREPQIYMYGMLCALVSSGTWLIVATYLELPVSTTHSIVGAVMGFAFVYGGAHAVVWLEPQDEFPYMKGMVPIVVSWFISPLLSALACALFFAVVRTAILRRARSLELAFWALPLLVLVTVYINSYFVLYKGADSRISWSSAQCAWVAAAAAGGCCLLTVAVGMPLVRTYVYAELDARRRQQVSELRRKAKSSADLGGRTAHPAAPPRSASRPGEARSDGGGGMLRGGGGGGSGSSGGLPPYAQAPGFTSPFVEYPRSMGAGPGPGPGMRPAHMHPQLRALPPPQPAFAITPPLPPTGAPAPSPSTPDPPRPASPGPDPGHEGLTGPAIAGGLQPNGSAGPQPLQQAATDPDLLRTAEAGARAGAGGAGTAAQGSQGQQLQQLQAAAMMPPEAIVAVAVDGAGGGAAVEAAGGTGVPEQDERDLTQAPDAAQEALTWQQHQQQQQRWQRQQWQPQQQQQQWDEEQLWRWQWQQQEQQREGQLLQYQQASRHSQLQTQQRQQELWQQQSYGMAPGQHQGPDPQQLMWQQQQQQAWDRGQAYYQQSYGPQAPLQHQQQQQLWGQQQHYASPHHQQQQQPWAQQWQGPHAAPPRLHSPAALETAGPWHSTLAGRHQEQQELQQQPYGGDGNGRAGHPPPAAGGRLPLGGPIAESLEWGRRSVGGVDGGGAGAYGGGDGGGADGDAAAAAGGGNVQWQNTFDQLKAIVLHGTTVDVHQAITVDPATARIHAHAEVFDPATEHAFKYLQVVTAICDSFSHGANDVANSVGPLAAIWYIYRTQRVDYMADLPVWILVLGGAGIVVGLATYGYNIIRAIGVRFSAITPSRGFCIELSTAMVVALASKYGLPISTTHCQVGATAGMGLMEGAAGLNWRLALNFFLGWLVTLLLTGLLSAALFAAGAYAPSVPEGRALLRYQDALVELSGRVELLLNRTNTAALADPATWGNFSTSLNASVAAGLARIAVASTPGTQRATRPVQRLPPEELLAFLNSTLATYVNNSLPYVGGMAARGQVLPRRP